MKISLIVCKSQNNVIGLDGKLPWNIPEYNHYFHNITYGENIIAGHNTYVQMNKKRLLEHFDVTWEDNEQAYQHVLAAREDAWVIGGAVTFDKWLQLSDVLYVTNILKDYGGDCFFPEIDLSLWNAESKSDDVYTDTLTDEPINVEVIKYVRR